MVSMASSSPATRSTAENARDSVDLQTVAALPAGEQLLLQLISVIYEPVSAAFLTKCLAALDPPQQRDEPFDVHGFVQAVVQRLPYQRMVGDLARTLDVLEAGELVRKQHRHQVFRSHAQQRGRLVAGGSCRLRSGGGAAHRADCR